MDVETIRKILKEEYGISNDKEFEKTIETSEGIDVGIFTQRLRGKRDESVA